MSISSYLHKVIFLLLLFTAQFPASLKSQSCCDSVKSTLRRELPTLRATDTAIKNDLKEAKLHADKEDSILRDSIITLKGNVENIKKTIVEPTAIFLNRFWIFLSAVLVFFMQAGFKALEVGMSRKRHDAGIGMKNLLDWLVLSAAFFLWGFGFMYGPSIGEFIGWGFFGSDINYTKFSEFFKGLYGINTEIQHNEFSLGVEFVLYQLAFAGTAATIVSGAMAERTALTSYTFTALFVGGFIYPIFGHWVWGGEFIGQHISNQSITDKISADQLQSWLPWLKKLGFYDFAGSTVVHSVGGWVALVGCYFIGPRTGRFLPDGKINRDKFPPYSLGYAMLGVFILWFGWWGFNGGSTLEYNEHVAPIVLNTNICGAFAGLTAFFYALFSDKNNLYEKTIGGVLGGLVAITANCSVVSSTDAIIIGIFAGFIHNLACDFLLRIKIDDPVGAIPVHLSCGIWGTLCVGIFGDLKQIAKSTHRELDIYGQIGVQMLGILVAFAFVTSLSILLFWVLKNTIGLRVSLEEEESGKLY